LRGTQRIRTAHIMSMCLYRYTYLYTCVYISMYIDMYILICTYIHILQHPDAFKLQSFPAAFCVCSPRTCCLLVFTALDVGCWMDTADRALLGGPQDFGHNVETCKSEALRRGSTIFALQAGGWCTTSTGTDNYTKYGKASADPCPALGGPWINHVFAIVGGLPPRLPASPLLRGNPRAGAEGRGRRGTL
jgi:hypothetical protein